MKKKKTKKEKKPQVVEVLHYWKKQLKKMELYNYQKEGVEKWHDISGYEGQYQVSDRGRIRGLLRVRKGSRGGIAKVKGKVRKKIENEKGYMSVQLWKNNKGKIYKIHRLVAFAFLPNSKNLPEVDHINKKRHDNHVKNLRWISVRDNRQRK